MKTVGIPAIRAKIGIWVYYIATLKFSQVEKYVKKVDDELHKSTVLREMLQRSITDNYKSIAQYIEDQEERFFNSLVLAVYDGDPKWHEIRLDYGNDEEYYDIGILELTGEEKIFPVDGQHRVEGIKKVLQETEEFNEEKIPVIFIGHKKDADGMRRARRLFSTLNRYAKPVSMRDIIALDEDDSTAIISRELIENHPLFENERVFDAKTKAIPDSNKTAFTSIITFYECNQELLYYYLRDKQVKNPDGKNVKGKSKIKNYIKIRPSDNELDEYRQLCMSFWNYMMLYIDDMRTYMNTTPNSEPFRNKEGGNILFRPVALIPIVKAIVQIAMRTEMDFEEIIKNINTMPLHLIDACWKGILWDVNNKKMIMNNQATTELLFIFMYDKSIMSKKEREKLAKGFAAARQIEINDAIGRLSEFKENV